MAEINTSIYGTIQPPKPMTPAEALGMIGQMNQIKLFDQTYRARENIGKAYRGNVNADGTINNQGLIRDIGQTGGFLAGEGVGTAMSNTNTQLENQMKGNQYLRTSIGALADLPNPTLADVNNFAVRQARNTNIPLDVIKSFVDSLPTDPKELKKALVTMRNMGRSPDAVAAGETGTPTPAGVTQSVTSGQAAYQRAGVGQGAPAGMPISNPPGFSEAATASSNMMTAARARAANYGNDIYPMTQALGALERLGPQGTGPGTEPLNTFKSFLVSVGADWLPGVDVAKIKDYDEARKYLTQAAGSAATRFGHGTDQALATSLTASPNTHISNLAAKDLTKATIGLRRMEHAMITAADAAGIPEGQYAKWSAQFGGKVDPRAFMVDLYTPEQFAKLNKDLKPGSPERKRFNQTLKMAIDLGIIDRPPGKREPGTEIVR